jgi:hypothetical protein
MKNTYLSLSLRFGERQSNILGMAELKCELEEGSTVGNFTVKEIRHFQGNGISSGGFPEDQCVVKAIAEDPRFRNNPKININKGCCALCKRGVSATLVKTAETQHTASA